MDNPDNPQIVPTTLEQDLFGPPSAFEIGHSIIPPNILAKDAHDYSDLPPPSTTGLVVESDLVDRLLPAKQPDEEEEDDEEEEGGLFGDEGESDEDDTNAVEAAQRSHLEYPELSDSEDLYSQTIETIQKSESIAQVELANFGLPEGDRSWVFKLPNFLGLVASNWDELMWEPSEEEIAEDDEKEEGERRKGGTVADEYVVRWRWAKDTLTNSPIKQSNTRVIKWSDGSLTLQIGSEQFDITTLLTSPSSLSSTSLSLTSLTTPHSQIYLTSEHAYSTIFEAQSSIHGTFSFRPTNLQSETHKRFAKQIHAKNAVHKGGGYGKTKMTEMPEEDPEKVKAEKERKEVERFKKVRKEQQRLANRGRGGKKSAGGGRRKVEDIYSDGEESGGEEEGWKEARRGVKRGVGGPLAREDSEELSDANAFLASSDEDSDEGSLKKKQSTKRDEMDEIEERAEREERRRKFKKSKVEEKVEEKVVPRRRMVVDDDEDE